MLRARSDDVALEGDTKLAEAGYQTAAILIRSSKTGRNQTKLVYDPLLRANLGTSLQLARYERSMRLFHISYPALFQAIKNAACTLGIDSAEVTTHSCRHGEGMTLFLPGEQADTIAQRGRWDSHVSLSRCFRNGKGRILSMKVDDYSPRWNKETQLAHEKASMMPLLHSERAKATGLEMKHLHLHS